MTTSTYPVKVTAQMDVRLNRSLWLMKWLLVIPELQELTVARRSPFGGSYACQTWRPRQYRDSGQQFGRVSKS